MIITYMNTFFNAILYLEMQVRDEIINQKSGSKFMMTKYHLDSMVRFGILNVTH